MDVLLDGVVLLVDGTGVVRDAPAEQAQTLQGRKLLDLLGEGGVQVAEAAAAKTASLVSFERGGLEYRARIIPLSGGDTLLVFQEEEARSLNERRLAALAALNEMTEATLQEIAEFTLEEAVRLTGSRIGYLSFASEDEQTLSMHSWSRQSMAECSVTEKIRSYHVGETGLWGEAVRQRRPIITNDYASPHPLKRGYPEGHVPILRHMNAPIFDEGRIVIVAGVGNKETPYEDADVRQLTLLMQGMWRIIQRRRSEQILRQNEEDLRLAKEAAEAANVAKSDFLANMSHEMRTPLTGVLGMVDLVLDSEIGGEERTYLEMARNAGESLLRLISDLLDISRIEAGQMNLERREFGLRRTVASAIDVVTAQSRAKGIRLTWNIYPTVPERTFGDEGRLHQVLVNLLGNAVKFTEKGEVHLSVQTARDSEKGGAEVVLFSVRDTGIGIPMEKMDDIFGKFTQVDASTSRRYGGSGLGLALSREMVTLMGGRLWAESRLGEGSTFSFTCSMAPPAAERENVRHMK